MKVRLRWEYTTKKLSQSPFPIDGGRVRACPEPAEGMGPDGHSFRLRSGVTVQGPQGWVSSGIFLPWPAVRYASMLRDLETVIPALFIPVFMFAVTVGALQDFAETIPGLDYRAFQLPVAVLFAVTACPGPLPW